MKKYIFSIISIFIGILLNLITFIDTPNKYNIYPIHFVDLMDNMIVLFILSLISISCAIISLKKYNEQGLSSIGIILNMFPGYLTLLNFLSI
ncbi:hypothetical protein [Clostridium tarantellae]|uniref:Uncharacterized protein n=1 Tax=Clostridium tarantellae TaxID=39493 RepID=A0A6I1MP62_9CLOT|nr:hypothetical protein [Clostridium tarantellae]MPQ45306.1 hypothetical protein [Clostridium tarantellae]